jgi:predicted ATPase
MLELEMSDTIKTISISGFKSIRTLQDFPLRSINVLIGSNGAGKSNFISFFKFLREIIESRLQVAVQRGGGADAFLFMGPRVTRQISVKTRFGMNGYDFTLVPTVDGRLIFEVEKTYYKGPNATREQTIGSGNEEARIMKRKDDPGAIAKHGVPYYVHESVSSWIVYHFHDTSETSSVRRYGFINDNEMLRPDASNLAAFLYRMRETNQDAYEKIVSVIGLAAPFFRDFALRPHPLNPEQIQLEWLEKASDIPFLPSQLSDGTLRFICLATALLQPNLPATLLFDEPELGLHPYALLLLSKLMKTAVAPYEYPVRQIIISTQSALLLNEFSPEDIIVVDRSDGQSTFTRLQESDLNLWLDDYTLGELWQKNILGGRPRSNVQTVGKENELG